MSTVRTVCVGVDTVFLVPLSRAVSNSVYTVMRGPAVVSSKKRYVNGVYTKLSCFLLHQLWSPKSCELHSLPSVCGNSVVVSLFP